MRSSASDQGSTLIGGIDRDIPFARSLLEPRAMLTHALPPILPPSGPLPRPTVRVGQSESGKVQAIASLDCILDGSLLLHRKCSNGFLVLRVTQR